MLTGCFELLELRNLLSATVPTAEVAASQTHDPHHAHGGPSNARTDFTAAPTGLAPDQVRNAYAFSSIAAINGTAADGTGQTIAIVMYDTDPNIAYDVDKFDQHYNVTVSGTTVNLYTQYGSASGSNGFLTVVNQYGQSSPLPTPVLNSDAYNAAEEISLDVEMVHAMAPGAKILLVEANSNILHTDNTPSDLYTAVDTARNWPGVSVVSMSWGDATQTQSLEYQLETGDDYHFTTPSGHPGVTFVAASGDHGSPAGYPAYSPNVVAVGGTVLTTDSFGHNNGETGWSGSGGGPSQYEVEPGYQQSVQSSELREAPDVSFMSLTNTGNGVSVFDTYQQYGPPVGPWDAVVGTSVGAPAWAAAFAIANQARAASGLGALDGRKQALPDLYTMSATNFNDITSGSNGGHIATTGYDQVTGRGSLIAASVVPALAATMSPSAAAFANGEQVAEVADVANPNLQDLFTVGSDGNVRENQFNDSTHSATGQFVVDPSGQFPAGARITAYNDGSSINLFAVNKSGQMVWDQQKNGVTTSLGTFSTQYPFTPGETVVVQAQTGALNIFAVATDGYIRQYQYISSNNQWSAYLFSHNLYMNPGTPLSASYDGPSGILDFYGELPDANIGQWQFVPSSGWSGGEIDASGAALPVPNGSAPGVPLALVQAYGHFNIFAVNRNGDVGQVQYSYPGGWGGGVIPASGAHLAVGTALQVNEASNYVITIVGANTDGNIGEVQYVPSSGWGVYTVAHTVEAFAAGSMVTFIAPSGSEFEIFGIGVAGDMLDEELTPSAWTEYDLR